MERINATPKILFAQNLTALVISSSILFLSLPDDSWHIDPSPNCLLQPCVQITQHHDALKKFHD